MMKAGDYPTVPRSKKVSIGRLWKVAGLKSIIEFRSPPYLLLLHYIIRVYTIDLHNCLFYAMLDFGIYICISFQHIHESKCQSIHRKNVVHPTYCQFAILFSTLCSSTKYCGIYFIHPNDQYISFLKLFTERMCYKIQMQL